MLELIKFKLLIGCYLLNIETKSTKPHSKSTKKICPEITK